MKNWKVTSWIAVLTMLFLIGSPQILGGAGKGGGKGKPGTGTTDPVDPGASSSVEVIDTGGRPVATDHDLLARPVISYFQGMDLRYARKGSDGWTVESLGQHGDYVHNGIDLALDPAGLPAIVFDAAYSTGIQELKYAFFDGLAWRFETIDIRSRDASVAFDGNGVPHVSYRKVLDKDHSILCVARRLDGGWSMEVVDASPKSYTVGGVLNTSIEVSPAGAVGVSYGYSAGPNYQTRFATRGENGWGIQVVESGFIGTFSSLRFDGSSRPHVAYVASGSGGQVRLASGDGAGGWRLTTLPFMGEFPVDVDLGLSGSGAAVVSFRDSLSGTLFFLTGTEGNFTATQVTTAYSKAMSHDPVSDSTGLAIGNGLGLIFQDM